MMMIVLIILMTIEMNRTTLIRYHRFSLKEIAMTKWKYLRLTGAALILSGTLSAWAADRNSAKVPNLDDGRITTDVKAAIAQHRDLGAPNQIYVDTRDHVVFLSGVVYNSLSGDNAIEIARQVPGVTRVVSTIGVDK
jgi:hypothetical protein